VDVKPLFVIFVSRYQFQSVESFRHFFLLSEGGKEGIMAGEMYSSVALKEWSAVVEAMASGRQLLLVRKGGIRDEQGVFQLKHREFLLYPTTEHQRKEALRPEFEGLLPQGAPHPPHELSFQVYAGVAYTATLKVPQSLAGLERYHIWRPEFFENRMAYKPDLPTVAAVVRAYRLRKPVKHRIDPAYAGCKSWVDLTQEVAVDLAEPVLDNRRFREALRRISSSLDAQPLSR
jgi:hypothetical protein